MGSTVWEMEHFMEKIQEMLERSGMMNVAGSLCLRAGGEMRKWKFQVLLMGGDQEVRPSPPGVHSFLCAVAFRVLARGREGWRKA